MMRILSLIGLFLHAGSPKLATQAKWAAFSGVILAVVGTLASPLAATAIAQDSPSPQYPLSVAASGEKLFVVDLDLPGVWQIEGDKTSLYVRGSNLLRKPMNRPRAITPHPSEGILVGDSATREVYHIAAADAEPKPLADGHLGNVMALAVSPDKKTIYAGDAEKRALFRLPIEGGKPELVARVNARGLAFDDEGKLWAVTPDADAVVQIDVESKEVKVVVTDRPFQFANGLVWAGDHGFVTDNYSNCVWKFTADGKTEKWVEGDPMGRPVGIAITQSSVLVADPLKKQVFEINRESKEIKTRM